MFSSVRRRMYLCIYTYGLCIYIRVCIYDSEGREGRANDSCGEKGGVVDKTESLIKTYL